MWCTGALLHRIAIPVGSLCYRAGRNGTRRLSILAARSTTCRDDLADGSALAGNGRGWCRSTVTIVRRNLQIKARKTTNPERTKHV